MQFARLVGLALLLIAEIAGANPSQPRLLAEKAASALASDLGLPSFSEPFSAKIFDEDAPSLRRKWKLSPQATAEYTGHFILRYVLAHPRTAASTFVLWNDHVYSVQDDTAFTGQKGLGKQPPAKIIFAQFHTDLLFSLLPDEKKIYLKELSSFLDRLELTGAEKIRTHFASYFERFGNHSVGAALRIAEVRAAMLEVLAANGFTEMELARVTKSGEDAHEAIAFELPKVQTPPLSLGTDRATPTLSGAELLKEASMLISSTFEGKFLLEWERQNSTKVFFFGGSVPRILQRALTFKLSGGHQPLSLVELFGSDQDIDIAVDGDAGMSKKLWDELGSKHPTFFASGFSRWEVRALKNQTGKKAPILLANGALHPDLVHAHNDSLSLSVMSLHGEFFDLRHGGNAGPNALNGILSGEIEYFFSSSHHETTLASDGRNPPWISVMRYLVKASEFQLDIPLKSWTNLSESARGFSDTSLNLQPRFERKTSGWLQRILNKPNYQRGLELLHSLPANAPSQSFLETLLGNKACAAIVEQSRP